MNKQQELVDALQAIPWFQDLSDEHFKKMCAITHLVNMDKDTTIFSEGEKDENLYIVLEGRVAIEIYSPVRGRLRIFTAEPLDVVGWSSVTPVIRQRTASARAVLDSRLAALDGQALRKLCDEDWELGYKIMRRIANVVAARLMVTRLQLLDVYGHPEEGQ
ncbi:MAG: cyclic nucleotide-binding domain-containing protein [Anaerolineales bacterium]|nr:cyclic nucleotide-binding domain-containing protein [Anaerolineales bacterium]